VNRITGSFTVTDFNTFKMQMLGWANRFNICAFLDNHQYSSAYHAVECLVAVNAVQQLTDTQALRSFYNRRMIGYSGISVTITKMKYMV